jgi:hypothetical protein
MTLKKYYVKDKLILLMGLIWFGASIICLFSKVQIFSIIFFIVSFALFFITIGKNPKNKQTKISDYLNAYVV